eukprot:352209-Hanusia_phi.AAC.3
MTGLRILNTCHSLEWSNPMIRKHVLHSLPLYHSRILPSPSSRPELLVSPSWHTPPACYPCPCFTITPPWQISFTTHHYVFDDGRSITPYPSTSATPPPSKPSTISMSSCQYNPRASQTRLRRPPPAGARCLRLGGPVDPALPDSRGTEPRSRGPPSHSGPGAAIGRRIAVPLGPGSGRAAGRGRVPTVQPLKRSDAGSQQ